jgi:hypothetical protein
MTFMNKFMPGRHYFRSSTLSLNFPPLLPLSRIKGFDRRLHKATQAEDINARTTHSVIRSSTCRTTRRWNITRSAAVASATPPPEAIAHTAAYTPTAEGSGHAYCDARSPASSLPQQQRAYSRLLMMSSFVPIFVVKAAVSCARVSGTRICAANHCLTFSILLVMLAVSFLFSLEAYDPTPLTASRGHVMKKGGKI